MDAVSQLEALQRENRELRGALNAEHRKAVEMTDAHELRRTLHEIAVYPEHGPREGDPQYAIFHAARHHLIDVLGVGCWIGGATKAQIEAGLPEGHLCSLDRIARDGWEFQGEPSA